MFILLKYVEIIIIIMKCDCKLKVVCCIGQHEIQNVIILFHC